MKESKSKLFKHRLFRAHVAAGITFSLVMYISIFFGVFAIFLPYLKTWEKPSRHIEKIEMTKIDYNSMIEEVLKDPDFPKNDLLVNLPGRLGDPAVTVSHRFVKPIAFNPKNGEKIENESEKVSYLADFLNHLHYGQPLKLVGRLLFGFVAVGTLSLIITGLILIIIMKFKNQGRNQQAIFSKIHVDVFTWAFLPFLLITISGAVMNVGLISSGPMSQILTDGKAKSIDGVVGTVLFPRGEIVKKDNIKGDMQAISELLIKAQKINPELTFKQIKIKNWNDTNARVEFLGYNPYKPFFNGGIFNTPSVTLNANTGELIKNKKVMDNVWPVFLAEGLFFLHFLFGIDIFSRIFIAILMALCGIAIGFGVMLWLEKKAKKFDNKITFYHWMGKLSLATMVGIIPATAVAFVLQWGLPFSLEDRVLWQQGAFYNTWLFTLFWSFYRINSYTASKEFFFTGGVLFILSTVIHNINSGFNIFSLINQNMTEIFAVDLTLFIFGALLIYVSIKLPKNRKEAKLFWPTKQKKVQK